MENCPTQVFRFQSSIPFAEKYRSAVSLHSHTMHSREYLGRFPHYVSKIPIAHYLVEREVGRMHLYTGRTLDFRKIYWTPPLSPLQALELEQKQIRSSLGLAPLVSLTDHDNIEAGMRLHILEQTSHTPISLEWTAPSDQTVFHLGVHNLPFAQASYWMTEFSRYTAKPSPKRLRELLHDLNQEPSVLLVLNHPYWSAEGVQPEQHREGLLKFLQEYGTLMHAVEVNGLRSRKENAQTLKLGQGFNLPVISGGDRHGCEPNAVLNLTNAATFAEFIDEVRHERKTEIVLMPQYFEPLRLRLLESAWHALSNPSGDMGQRDWMARVFVEGQDGVSRPVTELTGDHFQRFMNRFRWIIALLTSPRTRPAVRIAFLNNDEGGL
jgi:hypothetical protein